MLIHELAKQTGLPTKTIRYYESIGLVPPPQRTENNYRAYTSGDADWLRFIAAARSLGFSLDDVAKFLEVREGSLPCQQALGLVDQHLAEIDRRIADLLALRETLAYIRQEGRALPKDKICDDQCVCYLLTHDRKNGQVTIQREEKLNV